MPAPAIALGLAARAAVANYVRWEVRNQALLALWQIGHDIPAFLETGDPAAEARLRNGRYPVRGYQRTAPAASLPASAQGPGWDQAHADAWMPFFIRHGPPRTGESPDDYLQRVLDS